MRARRVISSKVRIAPCGRNWCASNTSRGMQYTQRKLQRSVTEMRRSRIGRARVSTSLPPVNGAAAGRRSETRGMTFFIALFLWGNHSRAAYSAGRGKADFSDRDHHATPKRDEPVGGVRLGALRRRAERRQRQQAPRRAGGADAVAARWLRHRASARRSRGLLPESHRARSARLRTVAHGGRGRAAGSRHGELGGSEPLDGRRSLRRRREDARRDIRLGGRVGREELQAEALSEAHQAALLPASEGPRVMAEEKEAFLSRWSRLKREAPEKEKALEVRQAEEAKPAPVLPPVESLTPQSEFAPFMQPKVDDALRRVALKKLFGDPHFNTPDPFEPFSGDWTVGEAITPEVLATLNQARTVLFAEAEKKPEEEQQAKGEDESGRQDT